MPESTNCSAHQQSALPTDRNVPMVARTDTAAPGRMVCFGKVPTQGDFVRHNAYGPATRHFDTWLREGLYQTRNRFGVRAPFDSPDKDAIGFVSCPTTCAGLLAGGLRWSRDASGRRYPLVVGYEWAARPTNTNRIASLPVTRAAAFRRAGDLLSRAVRGDLHPSCLFEGAEHDRPTWEAGASEPTGDSRSQRRRQILFLDLAATLWDNFEDTRKYLVARNLLDTLAPFRSRLPAGFHQGLRFPLGGDGPVNRPEVVRFWVTSALSVLKARGVTPTFFWPLASRSSGPAPDSSSHRSRASLLLFLRPPPPSGFQGFFAVGDHDDDSLDVERRGRLDPVRSVLALPPRLGRCLESQDSTLDDVLQRFSGA